MINARNIEYILGGLVIAFFIVICAVMLTQMSRYDRERGDSYLEGSGTQGDPYVIGGTEDYLFLSRELSDYGSAYAMSYIVLDTDIELEEADSGCVLGDAKKGVYFAGVFDGRGHCISGIELEDEYAALFPKLMGTVRNLNIKSSRMTGTHAAGIAGELFENGRIINCAVDAEIEGAHEGDICAVCRGYIENCVSNSDSVAVCRQEEGSEVSYVYESGDLPNMTPQEVADAMNHNIRRLLPECPYYFWAADGADVYMTYDEADTALYVSARVSIGGRLRDVQGFFSMPERRWLMVIPKSAAADGYDLSVVSSEGQRSTQHVDAKGGRITTGAEEYEVRILLYSDVPTVMVDFYDDNELSFLYGSTQIEEIGSVLVADETGRKDMSSSDVIFSGRGNDSYAALKKGYSIELPVEMSIAGMEKSLGYNLVPGFRDNCFFTYVYTRDLYREMKLDFAQEYKAVNLFINGKFQGLYFLTEKMTISRSSFDLENLAENTKRLNGLHLYEYPVIEEGGEGYDATRVYYDLPHIPEDVTGGYLMEITMLDYALTDSRFKTDAGVIISSKADKYLGKGQLDYIQGLFQDFEDAVRASDGYNDKGVYYADYIDMESFADQWILYELAADLALDNSVYYYKDSDLKGDGKLHAVWDWDVEHMLADDKRLTEHLLMRRAERGADCSVNKVNSGNFWTWIYAHEDFRKELAEEWSKKIRPALLKSLSSELIDNKDGVGSFNWYRTDYSESFEINDRCWINTAYLKKISDLEDRIAIRINVLDRYFTGE